MLGTSLWWLAQHPEARQRLIDDPALWPSAVEELLRRFAPVSVVRIVTEDVSIDGQVIPQDEHVLLPFPAGNLDGEAFPEPHTLQLDRAPNRHLAFGAGVHRCIGAHLARMELRVGLEEFLRAIPDFELDGDDPVSWKPGQIRGPSRLPSVGPVSEVLSSICRLCTAHCPILVTVRDGVVAEVHGDRDVPVFEGYTCPKGRPFPPCTPFPDACSRAFGAESMVPTSRSAPSRRSKRSPTVCTTSSSGTAPKPSPSTSGRRSFRIPRSAVWRARCSWHSVRRNVYSAATIDQPGMIVAEACHGVWMEGGRRSMTPMPGSSSGRTPSSPSSTSKRTRPDVWLGARSRSAGGRGRSAPHRDGPSGHLAPPAVPRRGRGRGRRPPACHYEGGLGRSRVRREHVEGFGVLERALRSVHARRCRPTGRHLGWRPRRSSAFVGDGSSGYRRARHRCGDVEPGPSSPTSCSASPACAAAVGEANR